MTSKKVLEVIEVYRQFFIENSINKIDYSHDEILEPMEASLNHCYGMLDKMVQLIHEGRIEKSFRWLGFIQGVLWVNRAYKLSDLKNHNKPS